METGRPSQPEVGAWAAAASRGLLSRTCALADAQPAKSNALLIGLLWKLRVAAEAACLWTKHRRKSHYAMARASWFSRNIATCTCTPRAMHRLRGGMSTIQLTGIFRCRSIVPDIQRGRHVEMRDGGLHGFPP